MKPTGLDSTRLRHLINTITRPSLAPPSAFTLCPPPTAHRNHHALITRKHSPRADAFFVRPPTRTALAKMSSSTSNPHPTSTSPAHPSTQRPTPATPADASHAPAPDVDAAAALPALPPASSQDPTASSTATTTLEVDGKAVVLDHLGPMVVGRDGTVARIANWDELSEIERRNTLRVLGKRNQVRLAALRGEGEGKEGSKAVKAV